MPYEAAVTIEPSSVAPATVRAICVNENMVTSEIGCDLDSHSGHKRRFRFRLALNPSLYVCNNFIGDCTNSPNSTKTHRLRTKREEICPKGLGRDLFFPARILHAGRNGGRSSLRFSNC